MNQNIWSDTLIKTTLQSDGMLGQQAVPAPHMAVASVELQQSFHPPRKNFINVSSYTVKQVPLILFLVFVLKCNFLFLPHLEFFFFFFPDFHLIITVLLSSYVTLKWSQVWCPDADNSARPSWVTARQCQCLAAVVVTLLVLGAVCTFPAFRSF